jgi:hypothetical protein
MIMGRRGESAKPGGHAGCGGKTLGVIKLSHYHFQNYAKLKQC